MPVHTNSIGASTFIDLQGRLQPRSEQLEVLSRKGKDEVALRLTATKGRPVKLRSINYVASFAAAKTAIETYIGYKDGTKRTITQHSVSFGSFQVIDVIEVVAKAVTSVQGGLAGGEEVYHVCEWTVISVS